MSQPDPTHVVNTLRFLGKQLRVSQFRLKNLKREKRAIEKNETEARRTLNQIKLKIQRELDAHPDIVRKFTGFELEEEE